MKIEQAVTHLPEGIHIYMQQTKHPPNSLVLLGRLFFLFSFSSFSFFVSFDPTRYSHQEEQLLVSTRPAAVSC
jgi:hypothetical protein